MIWIVEKIDEKTTRFTNTSDMDPKGSIPGFVKSMMVKKRAAMIEGFENIIKNDK